MRQLVNDCPVDSSNLSDIFSKIFNVVFLASRKGIGLSFLSLFNCCCDAVI